MARQTIKDSSFRTLGYIETDASGRQTAKSASFRTLGYYDPKMDVTKDASFQTVARGNVLAGLIYNQR